MTRARRAWRLLWLGTAATLLLTPSPAAAAAARTITMNSCPTRLRWITRYATAKRVIATRYVVP